MSAFEGTGIEASQMTCGNFRKNKQFVPPEFAECKNLEALARATEAAWAARELADKKRTFGDEGFTWELYLSRQQFEHLSDLCGLGGDDLAR